MLLPGAPPGPASSSLVLLALLMIFSFAGGTIAWWTMDAERKTNVDAVLEPQEHFLNAVAGWQARRARAMVLHALRGAPEGEGWLPEEVMARLPTGSGLTAHDVRAQLTELLPQQGRARDEVRQHDGRFWLAGT